MEKRIYSKLKYYLKEIKANAKVFYDEEAFDKEYEPYGLLALSPLVLVAILVITPLTIISFAFNSWKLMFVCCLFWVLVLCYILAILFRNL